MESISESLNKEKINNEQRLLDIEAALNSILVEISDLRRFYDNPDEMNTDLLQTYNQSKILSDDDFNYMLFFKGHYANFASQLQIVKALNDYHLFIDKNIDILNSKIAVLKQEQSLLIERNNGINRFNLGIISLTNKENIDKETMNFIFEFSKTLPLNEEFIDFLVTAWLNYYKQKDNKPKESVPHVDPDFDEMVYVNDDLYISDSEFLSKKKEMLKAYQDFSNSDIRKNNPDLFASIMNYFSDFPAMLKSCTKEQYINIDYALNSSSMSIEDALSTLYSGNEMDIASMIFIIQAGNDETKIANIIKTYTNNREYDYEAINKQYGIDETLQVFFQNYYKFQRLGEDVQNLYQDVVTMISMYKYQKSITITDLNILLDSIARLNRYAAEQNIDNPSEDNISEINAKNYLIFLDKEAFLDSYEKLKRKYTDLTYADLYRELLRFISLDKNKLHTDSSIKLKHEDEDIYKLREYKNNGMRIDYKVMKAPTIDGKSLYAIVAVRYGKIDETEKRDAIRKTYKYFEDSNYYEIESLFKGAATYDELSPEAQKYIDDGLSIIDELKELNKEENKSMDGGDNL